VLTATLPVRKTASSLGNVVQRHLSALRRRYRTDLLLAPVTYSSVAVGAFATLPFNRNLMSWMEAALYSPPVILAQSRRAVRALEQVSPRPGVILQFHRMFSSVSAGEPGSAFCLFTDGSFHPDVGYPAWGPRCYREWYFRFQSELYSRCNFVFTYSDWAREQIVTWHGIPEEQVITVGAGANTDLPGKLSPIPRDAPRLLFVGTGFRVKGVDYLLRAFPLVREKLPDAQLHLVGQPKDMRLPPTLPAGVEFHGPIYDRPTLDRMFEQSTALVLPSRWEMLGHVILESFAFGRPVIASRMTAIPEWVEDGVTGFTVPSGDVDALAARCFELLSDPAAAERMGRAGYQRVSKDGTWDSVVNKMSPYLERAALDGPVRG
jgi:glycosyltransferase involved in cell wall biosynthesis